MQINADSIVGKEGFATKRYCRKLMKYDLVQFVGSDCHNTDKPCLQDRRGLRLRMRKKWDEAYADHLFIENPRRILAGCEKKEGKIEPNGTTAMCKTTTK